MEFIDLKAQQNQVLDNGKTLGQDINSRIKKVLDHGRYIQGPEVKELEIKLAEYVGVKHCIGVASGTDALIIALMSIGIKPGDEVITTPFSFFATVETILLLGAKPVFVDVENSTYNLDFKKIEIAISRKTKAIIPVSLYGQPANFKEINLIAKKYNIAVIEDGAQSFGSKHHNKRSCGLSTIGVTSFFPSKPLGCYGDGGACFTNNDLLANSMRKIASHGQDKRYEHTQIGINGRLDTIQAAVLLAKLNIFEREVNLRQGIGDRYTQKLNKEGFQKTPILELDNTSVYAQYTVQVESRDKIIEFLKSKSIPTAIHYPKLLSDQVALNNKKCGFLKNIFQKKIYKTYGISNSRNLVSKVLSLPMHPMLSDQDQDLVLKTLIEAIEHSKKKSYS